MEDIIYFSLNVDVFRHVIMNELKILIPDEMADIVNTSREEIIHADDSVSLLNQSVAEVRAEEPRSSRDDADMLTENRHDLVT